MNEVEVRGGEILVDSVRLKSLGETERLVLGLQQAARRAFGARTKAMGVPSMYPAELARALEAVEKQPDGDQVDLVVSMPGTIEVYLGNELLGFIEVREGGGYVPLF